MEHLTSHQREYLLRIQKIISRKKYKLLKKSLIEGKIQAKKECQSFVNELDKVAFKIYKAKINCVITRAYALVEQLLSKNPGSIVSMVLKLLKNIAEHTDVELTAHGDDAQIINQSLNEITLGQAFNRKITIIKDDTFERGSLVIKAHKSIIDAHIKTELNRAHELLLTNKEIENGSIY